jgi:hypothetical protein
LEVTRDPQVFIIALIYYLIALAEPRWCSPVKHVTLSR